MKPEKVISPILRGVKALVGEITRCLRSAFIELHENKGMFKCVIDETATEDDFELMSAVAGEIIADFPNCEWEEILQKISPPQPTNALKNVLYHQHEGIYWK